MRWGRIDEFRAMFSEASRPTEATVRAWVADPEVTTVVGRKIGRCIYIDLDHFENTTGDELVDRILRAAA